MICHCNRLFCVFVLIAFLISFSTDIDACSKLPTETIKPVNIKIETCSELINRIKLEDGKLKWTIINENHYYPPKYRPGENPECKDLYPEEILIKNDSGNFKYSPTYITVSTGDSEKRLILPMENKWKGKIYDVPGWDKKEAHLLGEFSLHDLGIHHESGATSVVWNAESIKEATEGENVLLDITGQSELTFQTNEKEAQKFSLEFLYIPDSRILATSKITIRFCASDINHDLYLTNNFLKFAIDPSVGNAQIPGTFYYCEDYFKETEIVRDEKGDFKYVPIVVTVDEKSFQLPLNDNHWFYLDPATRPGEFSDGLVGEFNLKEFGINLNENPGPDGRVINLKRKDISTIEKVYNLADFDSFDPILVTGKNRISYTSTNWTSSAMTLEFEYAVLNQ